MAESYAKATTGLLLRFLLPAPMLVRGAEYKLKATPETTAWGWPPKWPPGNPWIS